MSEHDDGKCWCGADLETRLVSNGPDDYDSVKWCPACREERER